MNKKYSFLRIVISVALQDAGEATRSLEIAKGIRDICPSKTNLEIVFLSHGSMFEEKILRNGFGIYKCEPKLEGTGFHADLKPNTNNFVGNKELAIELLKGEIEALKELEANLIIHGFGPFASIARRILDISIPSICFLPIPFQEDVFGSSLMKDVPDQLKLLSYLPVALRRTLMRLMPKALKLKAPILKQNNIIKAAEFCGVGNAKLKNIFDLLEADLTIVNDFGEFYNEQKIPDNFKIVGPLYSPNEMNIDVDPLIKKVLQDDKSDLKIFCTMGSSGTKKQLLEAIKAIISVKDNKWNAIILAPPAVCSLSEVLDCVGNSKGIYVTDRFVQASLINSMVDVVVCHGGQGTVQTAIANGTPIVGVAMQPEQQINLDNIVINGCAIRIPITRWRASNIQDAIKAIQNNSFYKKNADKLKQKFQDIDGKRNSAKVIWNFINGKVLIEK
ncbi:glycosyltransferase [Clostridium beijerinckii]|uniref:PGL/p-HBAD biosynthesis glycosyltransferasec n=1 Tax=Clostridium beijerinckii TaxID=1520 RepID=A0A1S8RZ49_CLOBE|nr:nucleotide disphospho-sugar-binding domain-containing protein [Clostridium beijerinckii]NRY61537.1 UDP:flavonoid glycosyltransferase YjiC (YdhE family) [Clostridium beijerinckii]OOM58464.1 PGL/p-HBAD biosynthesis glycosyltransferasec [Clostridium beijerinckii]